MPFTNIDPSKLVRTETYSDLTAGEIQCQIPILDDGNRDPFRQLTFAGATMVMNDQGQPVKIGFNLKATTLEEALAEWIIALNSKIEEINSQVIQNRILQGAGVPPSRLTKANGRQ